MRGLLIIALLTFGQITAFSQIEYLGTSDPKKLGEMVFKSFQNQDYETFAKYIFTEADCDVMSKNADVPDSSKINVVKQMKIITGRFRESSKENFDLLITLGKQKGIDWNKIELLDVKFEIQNQNNIQSSDIFLLCKHASKIFLIKLDNCHKSDAWLMMDKAEIKFKE